MLLIAVLWQLVAFSSARAASRASGRFNAAVREMNPDEMVSSARQLWRVNKEHPEVMLVAAAASVRKGRAGEAAELYASVLDSNAPDELKLQAKLGQVVPGWAGKDAGQRKASAAEMKRGLEEAARYGADSPDVELNRAILDAAVGERSGALEKIEASLGKLKKGRSAFLSTLWSAYLTAAACEVDAGGTDRALEWLARASAIKPASAGELAPQQRKLRLALAARMGANKEATKAILRELEGEKAVELSSAEKYDFEVARAIAYLNIDNREEAIRCLEEARKIDPDRVDALIALAFVKYRLHSRDRQIASRKAEVHYKNMASFPKPRPWVRGFGGRRRVRRASPAAIQEAMKLHAAEEEFIGHLRSACESGGISRERTVAIRWFLALVYMRQGWSLCNEPEAEARYRLAEEMLRAVVPADPKNAAASRALGILAARSGDAETAVAAFRKSLAADPGQEALSKLMEGLSKGPEAVSRFPEGTARCATPLIGAVVNVRSWKGLDPERSKVFLDGSEVQATVLPAAVCHLPPRPLADRKHSARIVAVDVLGNSTETSFSFAVDGTPPKLVSFSPGRGESVSGPRLPIKVSLSDAQSGVSLESVKVVLSSRGMMRFADALVARGTYARGNSSFGVTYRAGQKIDPANFTVVNWRPLPAGEYEVEVYATDLRGNEMPPFKMKIVVGGGR